MPFLAKWRLGVRFFALALAIPTMLWGDEVRADEGGCSVFDQSHAAWTSILQKYDKDGRVSYSGLKAKGTGELDSYLRFLESICRKDYDGWNREERLAYWIDAYNAYTVKLILDHFPVKSIRSIGLLPLEAFRQSFIPLRWYKGRDLSLNDIEHDILRKEFQEPRTHFALVCASKSCPVLRSEAYRASDLERQLDDAARMFLREPTKNRFDAASKTLYLSSIFKWDREDFERAAGSLIAYVARYLPEPEAKGALEPEARVEFLNYDWSLNGD